MITTVKKPMILTLHIMLREAKVSRAMFKSNLALVTIDDIMNNDDEDQCYGADFLPSETTQCFATGLGTITTGMVGLAVADHIHHGITF